MYSNRIYSQMVNFNKDSHNSREIHYGSFNKLHPSPVENFKVIYTKHRLPIRDKRIRFDSPSASKSPVRKVIFSQEKAKHSENRFLYDGNNTPSKQIQHPFQNFISKNSQVTLLLNLGIF